MVRQSYGKSDNGESGIGTSASGEGRATANVKIVDAVNAAVAIHDPETRAVVHPCRTDVVRKVMTEFSHTLLPGISSRAEPEAPIVLSGLLEAERTRVERLARACGLETHGVRSRRDASGETWIGLLMRPSGAANPR